MEVIKIVLSFCILCIILRFRMLTYVTCQIMKKPYVTRLNGKIVKSPSPSFYRSPTSNLIHVPHNNNRAVDLFRFGKYTPTMADVSHHNMLIIYCVKFSFCQKSKTIHKYKWWIYSSLFYYSNTACVM